MKQREVVDEGVVVIRDLREGENAVGFELSASTFSSHVREVDELYRASSGCTASLVLTRIGDTLLLSGDVRGSYEADSARCLAPLHRELSLSLRWTLLPKAALDADVSAEEEVELSTEDLDTSFYEGETIDLRELVREAILLELDPIPRCDVDECGGAAYEQPPVEDGETTGDPRWAPLLKWKDKSRH